MAAVMAVAVLPCCAAWAADADQPLDDEDSGIVVVVTGSPVPEPKSESIATVTVITSEQIAETNAKTVADALRWTPGLTVDTQGPLGSLGAARLRGSTSNQVLVLIDGRRANPAGGGQLDLSDVLTENVDRIEVLLGPASAVYGADAVGGVINIITRPVRAPGWTGYASQGSHTTGDYRARVTVAGEQAALAVGSEILRSDGYRPNSDYYGQSHTARLHWSPGPTRRWTMELTSFSADKRLPGTVIDPRTSDWQSDRKVLADFYYQQDWSPRAHFEGRLYQNQYVLDSVDRDFGRYQATNRSSVAEARTIFEQRHGRLIAGWEWRNDAFYQRSAYSAPLSPRTINRAGYAEWRQGGLTAGVRYDANSAFGSQWSPRVGYVVPVSSATTLRLAAGRAFRAPTYLDLFSPPPFGVSDLRPERSWTYEAAVATRLPGGRAELSVFRSNDTDLIAGFPRSNIESARRQGAELAVSKSLGAGWRAEANYSYLSVDAPDPAQREAMRLLLPRNQASLAVHYDRPQWGAALFARYQDQRQDTDWTDWMNPLPVTLPKHTVFDAQVSRRIGAYRAVLSVNNLLDRSYDEHFGYPADGRSFTLALDLAP
jgi:outer membrane cobalamin receptor